MDAGARGHGGLGARHVLRCPVKLGRRSGEIPCSLRAGRGPRHPGRLQPAVPRARRGPERALQADHEVVLGSGRLSSHGSLQSHGLAVYAHDCSAEQADRAPRAESRELSERDLSASAVHRRGLSETEATFAPVQPIWRWVAPRTVEDHRGGVTISPRADGSQGLFRDPQRFREADLCFHADPPERRSIVRDLRKPSRAKDHGRAASADPRRLFTPRSRAHRERLRESEDGVAVVSAAPRDWRAGRSAGRGLRPSGHRAHFERVPEARGAHRRCVRGHRSSDRQKHQTV
mmetsp:Transcript_105452/g.296795  ORF Transcript_105452/g.296795 Transcript_105452/m.296795 type:complete len:289 (+) Transcript_105452:40-906(+)